MNEITSKNKQEDIEIYSSSLSLLRSTPERNLEERPLSTLTDSLMEEKRLKYKKRDGENEYQDELCEYIQDILVLAVKQGNESQIRQLLTLQNGKINSLDMGLWFACKNNDVSIAELLMDNGASPDYTLCKIPCIHLSALHGATSLIFSSFEKYPGLSKLRMRESVRLQVTPDRPLIEFPEGALPVHMCAFGGLSSLPLLEALLKHSPEVDIGDAKERSPLMYASIGGNCFSVRALLQRGADIEHKCKEGKTSLLYAADNGKNSVLELLIKRNASLDVTDSKNVGVFSYAKDEGVAKTILSCTTSCREESAVELLPIRELATKEYHQTLKNLLDGMITTTQDDKICIDLGQLELKPPDCERKEKLLNIISKQSPNLPLFDSIVLRSYAEHHMKR